MKKFVVFSIVALLGLFSASEALAQYDFLFNPITPKEVEQNRKLGWSMEKQYFLNGDKKQPYGARMVNQQGKLMADVTYEKRTYYGYDKDGRLMGVVDSVRKDNGFTRSEYRIGYDDNGKLLFMNHPNNHTSAFAWFPGRNVLEEHFNKGEHTFRRYYYYDNQGKITFEDWRLPNNNREKTRRYTYDSLGRLQKQSGVDYSAINAIDSTLMLYFYDKAGNVTKISTYSAVLKPGQKPGDTPEDEGKSVITTFLFRYDANGNLVSEEYKSNNSEENYKYVWEYNKQGLKTKEYVYDAQGKLAQINVFEYDFWEKTK